MSRLRDAVLAAGIVAVATAARAAIPTLDISPFPQQSDPPGLAGGAPAGGSDQTAPPPGWKCDSSECVNTNSMDSALEVADAVSAAGAGLGAAAAAGAAAGAAAASTPPGSVGVPPYSHSFHYDPASNSLVEDMGTVYGPPMSLSCDQYADYCKASQTAAAKAAAAPQDLAKDAPDGARASAPGAAQASNGQAASGSQDQAADAVDPSNLMGSRRFGPGLNGPSDADSQGPSANASEDPGAASPWPGSSAASPSGSGEAGAAAAPADPDAVAQAAVASAAPFLSLPDADVSAVGSGRAVGAADSSGQLSAPDACAGGCEGQVTLGVSGSAAIRSAVKDMNALNSAALSKENGVDLPGDPKTSRERYFQRPR